MMRTIFVLVWAVCVAVIGFGEPLESEGARASISNDFDNTASNLTDSNTIPPTQNASPSGLLGSAPLTPANQIGSEPIENMLDNVNQSNTLLKAAMGFAKDGDYESALGLFAQSCEQGNAAGCFGTGLIYMYGANTGMPNPQKAVTYYYKACVGGDAVACANLAMAYDNGNGIKEDKEQAAQLYEVACQGGDSLGCTNAGWM
ncbi:tetratricopeptide repeat protein, partial [Helicobacter typhlonius]